jgi:hypothetical protein
MRKAWTASRVRFEALKALAEAVGTVEERILNPNSDPVVTRTVKAKVALEIGFGETSDGGPASPQTVRVEVKELWGDYTVTVQTDEGDWIGIVQGRYHLSRRDGGIEIRALRAEDGKKDPRPMAADEWEVVLDDLIQGVWGKTVEQAFSRETDPMGVGGDA